MIIYTDTAESLISNQLQGFFVGWPNPPTPETHLKLLRKSDYVVLAVDTESGKIVGFITAITDGVLAAYIPHLEVLSLYQGQGIGRELVRRMLAKLQDFYMIDLICDENIQPFYAKLGMRPWSGMIMRNYGRQSGS
ncbi:MAG TPA: GNAT family N-acetyltransferase [Chloroflexia bacterium]|nr:GNAT family N-acetyltransferase [Chloroflexia bacterium]